VGLGAAGLDLGGAVKLGAGCDGAVELLILLAVPVGEGGAVGPAGLPVEIRPHGAAENRRSIVRTAFGFLPGAGGSDAEVVEDSSR